MKKLTIIATAIILLTINSITGCSLIQSQVDESFDLTPLTPTPSKVVSPSNEPTVEPTNTPAPTPQVIAADFDALSKHSLNYLLQQYDLGNSEQVILVTIDDTVEKMYLMDKVPNGLWKVTQGPFEVQLGKNGIGKEKEGDGKSPIGVFELGFAFGRSNPPDGTTWPWRSTSKGDLWIEDPSSEYYNSYVYEDSVEKDWKNKSDLNISAYKRAIEVKYNPECEPYLGSAIFIHIWGGSRELTNGCTAIKKSNLEILIPWMNPDANTLLVQVPYDGIKSEDLCYLIDFCPDIVVDLDYAKEDNLLGAKLEGYNDNQAITKIEIAKRLSNVSKLLKNEGKKLVIYEAYRPLSADKQIKEWLYDAEDLSTQEQYYKNFSKKDLMNTYFDSKDMSLYIQSQVIHVSLVNDDSSAVDMGSDYMVFGEKAKYDYPELTIEQNNNREVLHDLMIQAGFDADDDLWWRFTLNNNIYVTKYNLMIE